MAIANPRLRVRIPQPAGMPGSPLVSATLWTNVAAAALENENGFEAINGEFSTGMHDSLDTKHQLRMALNQSGIRAALQYLNSLAAHRFTALYRFDDETLKSLYFFDRENPEKESMDEIPVLASYCVFVRDSERRFCVENSLEDARTVGHPKRLEVQAYCGVPLLDLYGKMFGTICHFDVGPCETTRTDVELMEEMATLLQNQIGLAASSVVKQDKA